MSTIKRTDVFCMDLSVGKIVKISNSSNTWMAGNLGVIVSADKTDDEYFVALLNNTQTSLPFSENELEEIETNTNKKEGYSVKKQLESIYDEICRELTNFENSDEEKDEMSYEDWCEIFYNLLVKVQNTINTLQED